MLTLVLIASISIGAAVAGEENELDLHALALSDLNAFAHAVSADARSDLDRARSITGWFAANFDWTATDYRRRSVAEILERKGGNCAELARVTTAALEELGLRMRRVREINLHVESAERQASARAKIAELGARGSVFGRRHNDHVWIEIYDSTADEWFPADPSLGVVGEEAWIAARLGFGERQTLDPSSDDMIAPFAVFAGDDLDVDRTRHYLVTGFDRLYAGQLSKLEGWRRWVELVAELSEAARKAFRGEASLHEHEARIAELATVYDRLREQFEARSGRPQSRR